MSAEIETRRIAVGGVDLEVRIGGEISPTAPLICVAHPIDKMGDGTVRMVRDVAGARVVCVGRREVDEASMLAEPQAVQERMVDDVEAVRLRLGLPPWAFWGMSGGGWLAQLYAKRHPSGVRAIVIESSCACLRERVRDPMCALSPWFPATRGALAAAGLLDDGAALASGCAPSACEWIDVPSAGAVLRHGDGAALLVAPAATTVEVKRGLRLFIGFDARPWLSSIRVPALVVAGAEDVVAPLAHSRALHEQLPNSEFLPIDGAGHVPATARHPILREGARQFFARIP